MERTIGKNTLGDNNKMKVDLKSYNRSTHNVGYAWRNTQTVGTLVPFMCEIGQRGDVWDVELEASILTHPTTGPLYGSLKYQADIFVCPIRLYNGFLHNNKLNIGMDMSKIKLPLFKVKVDKTDNPNLTNPNSQINPSCVMSYLGFKGYGVVKNDAWECYTNATSYIAYTDIFKNFYANRQEAEAYMYDKIQGFLQGNLEGPAGTVYTFYDINNINHDLKNTYKLTMNHSEGRKLSFDEINEMIWNVSVNGIQQSYKTNQLPLATTLNTTTQIQFTYSGIIDLRLLSINNFPEELKLKKFNLENIDTLREDILYHKEFTPFTIDETTISPYGEFTLHSGGKLNTAYPQYGLLLKTYNSDLFNNWVNTEWVENINSISSVSTAGGSFTMDSLNLASKVYDMMNRVAVSGGSYQDWLETIYTDNYFQKTETPVFVGGMSKEIVFQEVISQSATTDQPLGTLAGRGVDAKQSKKGGKIHIRIDEPSYIIGICSITPRIDYSQGNRFDTDLRTLDDLHKPALDNIGFEDLTLDKMSWTESNIGYGVRAAGKQPAWINYKTNFNKTFGNFAVGESESFMVLNRDYKIDYTNSETTGQIQDVTTYIDPSKYNYIFADTSLNAMNYWVQMGVAAEMRRLITASNIPNL